MSDAYPFEPRAVGTDFVREGYIHSGDLHPDAYPVMAAEFDLWMRRLRAQVFREAATLASDVPEQRYSLNELAHFMQESPASMVRAHGEAIAKALREHADYIDEIADRTSVNAGAGGE